MANTTSVAQARTAHLHMPNPTMDGLLEGEWHQTTFVNYLRICLAWAGLPGLDQNEEDLRRLTAGFLPL